AYDEVARVVGVDPHGVMVHVDALRRQADGLTAVVRVVDRRGRPVHAIRVLRIDADLRVIEGADVVVVRLGPRRPAVTGAIQTGRPLLRGLSLVDLGIGRGIRLDQGVHDLPIAWRD